MSENINTAYEPYAEELQAATAWPTSSGGNDPTMNNTLAGLGNASLAGVQVHGVNNAIQVESHADFITRTKAEVEAKQKAIADRTASAVAELRRLRAEAQNRFTTDIAAKQKEMDSVLAKYDAQLAELGDAPSAAPGKRKLGKRGKRTAKAVAAQPVKAVKAAAKSPAKTHKAGKSSAERKAHSERMKAIWAARKAKAAQAQAQA